MTWLVSLQLSVY